MESNVIEMSPSGGIVPLEHYICDHCGELITCRKDAWVEWYRNDQGKKEGFKIVHGKWASPIQSERGCWHYDDHPRRQDNHMENIPLDELLDWPVDDSVADFAEWAELAKRLHVPYYEQARGHLHDPEIGEIGLELFDPHRLKKIAEYFHQKEQSGEG